MLLRTTKEEFVIDREILKTWKRVKTLEKQRRKALDKKDFTLAAKLTDERKETLRRFI